MDIRKLFQNKKIIYSEIVVIAVILAVAAVYLFHWFGWGEEISILVYDGKIIEKNQISTRNQNQNAIFEIKKNEQNKTELKIPQELIPIMIDDALVEYFNNFSYECYETKGITEPQLKFPKIDLSALTNEELNTFSSKKYALVYKVLRSELTIQDYEYSYEIFDLNNDGVDEFIIEPRSLCASGKGSLRGGTNNGSFLFYQKLNNNWKNIGEISGSRYEVLETNNENYRDLRSLWNFSASCYKETNYKWDKEKLFYKINSSKDIGSCD